MNNAAQQLLRLKAQLRLANDAEVAAALGMSATALSERKRRGSFPEKAVRALAQRQPELMLDVEYILDALEPAAAAGNTAQAIYDMTLDAFVTVLSRLEQGDHEQLRASACAIYAVHLRQWQKTKAPALERGFSIQGPAGQIQVKPGPLARSIARLIEQDLHKAIARLPAAPGAAA